MTADAKEKAPEPKKKNALLKWTVRLFGSVVLLLVIAFTLYYFMVDSYIRGKMIEAGKNATGQLTKLNLADLRAFEGKLTLSKFNIANPKDFSADGVVDFSSCVVSVDTGSLMTNTVVVKEIVITDMVISIEQKNMRNNLAEIINYVQSQRGEETAGASAAPQTSADPNAGKGKELDVKLIRIVHPTIKTNLLGLKNSFVLKDIEMTDPLHPDRRKLIDLIARILTEISTQALANGNMPDAIKNSLSQIDNIAKKEFANLGKGLDKIGRDLDKNLQNIGKDVKFPDDLQKNLQNLGKDVKLPGDIKLPGFNQDPKNK